MTTGTRVPATRRAQSLSLPTYQPPRTSQRLATTFLLSWFLHLAGIGLAVRYGGALFEPPEESNGRINRFTTRYFQEPKVEKIIDTLEVVEAPKVIGCGPPPEVSRVAENTPSSRERPGNQSVALRAGVLSALDQLSGAAANVFGPGGLDAGIQDALAGLTGAAVNTVAGMGMGRRGAGGDGGPGAGNLAGIGRPQTRGAPRGHGLSLSGTGKAEVKIDPGKLILLGGLPRDVIQKTVMRYANQIRHCYEKELTKNPELSGKIVTQFTIGPDGAVSAAQITQTEMSNEGVESCLLRNIRRWVFPKPQGGGEVVVTYPWIFQAM